MDTNTGNNLQDISAYPDLPELEQVRPDLKAFGVQTLFLCIFCIFMTSMFLWLYLKYRVYLEGDPATIANRGLILMVACSLWIVFRILFSYSMYGTSREGFQAYAILRRKTIRWEDIVDVERKVNIFWGDQLSIHTSAGYFRFKTDDKGSRLYVHAIAASIWQHMRRYGRNTDKLIQEDEASFWEPVSESVPEDIECRYSEAIWQFIVGLCFIVVGLYVPVSSLLNGHIAGGLLLLGYMLIFLIPVYWLLMKNNPRRISVSGSAIKSEGILKKVSIPWEEVTSAGMNGYVLWIRAANPNRVISIPISRTTDENKIMALAVIRNLRTRTPQYAAISPLYSFAFTAWDWNKLKENKASSGIVAKAYIASQPTEIASRLRRANNSLSLIFMVPIISMLPCLFLDPLGRLSASIHSTQDTIFQYTVMWQMNAVLILLPSGVITYMLIKPYIDRTVASCREEWEMVLKLQGIISGANTRRIIYTLAIICILGMWAVASNYYRITTTAIYESPLFAFKEERYSFDQVKTIKQTAHRDNKGNLNYYLYTIKMDNGKSLKISDDIMLKTNKQKLVDAIGQISQSAKVPINTE